MSCAIGVDRFPSHLTPATGGARNFLHRSLPSPSSPSPSPPPVLPDDSLPLCNGHDDDNDDGRHVPSFSISEPISPLKGKRPTRNCRLTRAVNPTLPAKRNARKADPIKAILRERNREARAGGGIDALNRAEGYDHHTLLSDFSIEADDPVDTTRSRLADENITRVLPAELQTDDAGPDIAAEDEVLQDVRERLLGAKEGEAVGKILDADRKMGQTAAHCVSGVSVFVNDCERTVDAELCTQSRPTCEWARDKNKTATLQMLDEAIEHQGTRERSPFLPSFLIECN